MSSITNTYIDLNYILVLFCAQNILIRRIRSENILLTQKSLNFKDYSNNLFKHLK